MNSNTYFLIIWSGLSFMRTSCSNRYDMIFTTADPSRCVKQVFFGLSAEEIGQLLGGN